MALIKCPECGNDVSDQANACPHCGYEMAVRNEPATEDKKEVPVHKKSISILMLIMGCVLLLLSIHESKTMITNFINTTIRSVWMGILRPKQLHIHIRRDILEIHIIRLPHLLKSWQTMTKRKFGNFVFRR